MKGRFIPYVVGLGLTAMSMLMLLFTLYTWLLREPIEGFLITALGALTLGGLMRLVGRRDVRPTRFEAITCVLLLWLTIPLVGGVPFAISGHLTPLNALFESMSGFTTTGATVLIDFAGFPRSLFMWRSLMQWFGGIGIVVLFIAVLPQLAIAGRQMFFTEAPGPTADRILPRLRNTAEAVLAVYAGLTFACFVAYLVGGMATYDAAAHAFTTLSAGGFSPNGLSFAGYDSPVLDWTAVLFMTFAGANFALLYRAFQGRPRLLLRDIEFRVYLAVAAGTALLIAASLLSVYGVWDALRHGFFQSLSILTTAGYASADFALWPPTAQILLVALMAIGGSAGSAAGGIKVVRWLMVTKGISQELRQTVHPRGVFLSRLGSAIIPLDVMRAVEAFITLYIGLVVLSSVVLVLFGADFVTAVTASLACVGNIGPGLASVGPMASFAELNPFSRGLLIFDMYAGRLEIVTVFVLFDGEWWRAARSWFGG